MWWLIAATSFVTPTELAVSQRIEAAWNTGGIAQRIVDVTDPFVGAPYQLSALGEGNPEGPDADPRLRFDAFDCTTFVETALAMAHSTTLPAARERLDHIRYRDGRVGYQQRRHFPEAEWLPELSPYFVDVTRALGGDAVTQQSKVLNAAVWRRGQKPGLPTLPDERIPAGTFSLDVWPLADAALHLDRIPPGTLLHLVRVDFKNVPVRVSHQGIIIRKDGQLFMRHAADRMFHRVVDEPLDRFLARMMKYQKWPVSGIHLTQLREHPVEQQP
jgi:hypothetical protein